MSGWQTRVRKVTPYVPGEQPSDTNVIKLNTNESPYPPAPGVAEALQGQDAGLLRLYPSRSATGSPRTGCLWAWARTTCCPSAS